MGVVEHDGDAAAKADREERISLAADVEIGHSDQQIDSAHVGRR